MDSRNFLPLSTSQFPPHDTRKLDRRVGGAFRRDQRTRIEVYRRGLEYRAKYPCAVSNLTGDVRTMDACVVNGRIQFPWQLFCYRGTELADAFAGSTEAG